MDDILRMVPEPLQVGALRALAALLILAVGWWAVRISMNPLRHVLERSRVDPSAASFLANSARAALLIVVFMLALQHLGVETTSLLALFGAVGLALALSLQNSLANFAAGLMVLSFRMVRVGDIVEIGDVRGRVAELLPFHVVIVTADNLRVTLPNNVLTNGPVKNHSTMPTRRAQWTLTLHADDSLPAVMEALRGKLKADSRILSDPPPQLFVQDWGLDKRTLVVQAWTNSGDYFVVQQSLLEELGQAVEGARP